MNDLTVRPFTLSERIIWGGPPAVLVNSHDVALVLYAGDGGVVPVPGGEDLLRQVLHLPPNVRVLRSVEPQQRHHHLACKKIGKIVVKFFFTII